MNIREALTASGVRFSESPGELIIRCPHGIRGLHKNKAKLYISTEKNVFICFQCRDYKGSVNKLLRDLKIDPNLVDGVSNKKVSIDELSVIVNSLWKSSVTPALVEMKLPESYSTEWDRDSFGRLAYKYLKNRNLSDQAIHEYELGFCSEGDYKGYVIVPFYENGEIVFFQARKFLSLANKPDHKNPPRDSANGKSQVIFNLDRISKNRSVVITEGVFDAMAVKKNAIAILGKKMSKYQIDKLVSRGVNDIVILLDEDAFEETQQLAANLHDVFDRVAIARLKEYKDPGSAPRSEILGSLAKAHVYDPGGFSLISHKILTL